MEGRGADGCSSVASSAKPPAPQAVKLGRGHTWRTVMLSERRQRHRLGGAPSWTEFPEVKQCPGCGAPMHAAGQVADTGALFSDSGMLYGAACRVVSTFSQ